MAQAVCRREGEHTANMPSMVVTLDVSQLVMFGLKKLSRLEKRLLMEVMAETSHSAMGPYVALATTGFASKAWTAVFNSALLVKA